MGAVPLGTISHYWNRDESGILGNKFIQSLSKIGLTREVYQNINAHLHINSKLIVDELNENFKEFYAPDQFLSIDKYLSLFKGKNNQIFLFFGWKNQFFIIFFIFIKGKWKYRQHIT